MWRYFVSLTFWVALFTGLSVAVGRAHDPEKHELDAWYSSMKQPGTVISCCGIGDAYFCDGLEVIRDQTFCTVTDDREDEPRRRPHIPVGTKVLIPNDRLIDAEQAKAKGNPTGHGVIWMRGGPGVQPENIMVYCYILPDMI